MMFRYLAPSAICGMILGSAHLAGAGYTNWLRPLSDPPSWLSMTALAVTILAIAALFRIWLHASERRKPVITGALIGTFAGFGYFGVSLHWLGHAFLYPSDDSYTLRALGGAFASMGLFVPWWTAAMAVAAALRSNRLGSAMLLWAGCMGLADLMLSDLAYGIPLAPLSAVLLDTPLTPLVTILGAFGANTFLLALGAALGAAAWLYRPRARFAAYATLAASVAAVAAIPDPDPINPENPLRIAVGQPAGEQRIRPTYFDRTAWMADIQYLVDAAASARADVLILPELSIPFDPSLDPESHDLTAILQSAPENMTILWGYYATDPQPDGSYPSLNRVVATLAGSQQESYDKAYLVPFGEFMPQPFKALGFQPFTGTADGLKAGDGLEIWSVGASRYAVLICYESLMSGPVSRQTKQADWFANPTSEVMLRDSIGPYQVLQYTRLRAIELGKPFYRAAQTGWSAVIDSDGTIKSAIPSEITGLLHEPQLPLRPTVFAALGYLPLYALLALMLFAGIAIGRVKQRDRHEV